MPEITKETMEEYEELRRTGITNMFDYYNVISVSKKVKLKALAALSLDDYKYLLSHFGTLMKQYDIQQPGKKYAYNSPNKKENKT